MYYLLNIITIGTDNIQSEVHYSISLINAFFMGYRFFIGWFSILILFMIMNSYGYKQIGIYLGYKTFFNLNFILTYNMYVPVLSSYCVPCNRYWSWSFFWLMHWTISVTPFLHVVEAVKSLYSYSSSSKTAWLGLLFVS